MIPVTKKSAFDQLKEEDKSTECVQVAGKGGNLWKTGQRSLINPSLELAFRGSIFFVYNYSNGLIIFKLLIKNKYSQRIIQGEEVNRNK